MPSISRAASRSGETRVKTTMSPAKINSLRRSSSSGSLRMWTAVLRTPGST